jgi:hypothetical protein
MTTMPRRRAKDQKSYSPTAICWDSLHNLLCWDWLCKLQWWDWFRNLRWWDWLHKLTLALQITMLGLASQLTMAGLALQTYWWDWFRNLRLSLGSVNTLTMESSDHSTKTIEATKLFYFKLCWHDFSLHQFCKKYCFYAIKALPSSSNF